MVLKISQAKDSFLSSILDESMKEFNNFFRIEWTKNRPIIILVKDRKTFDELKKKKTEPWMVGFAEKDRIYLLDKKNFTKESSHKYSKEYYKKLLKHELAHLYFSILSPGRHFPIWLNEGLALFLAGQTKEPKPLKRDFLKFFKKGGKDVYKESGNAVRFLVEKHGKSKLIKLIKSLRKIETEEDFNNLFKKIYGLDPKTFF